MKQTIACLLLIAFSFTVTAQSWSDEQIQKANTARDINYISQVEKETILYLNLARLYPSQFVEIEIYKYDIPDRFGRSIRNSPYTRSLIQELLIMKPSPVLIFDRELYQSASCFAAESGDKGITGHNRTVCAEAAGYAECCSYGMSTGKDIAMQWLIDENVSNLGHRINCLNKRYSKIGVGTHSHKKYGFCAVADFSF